MVYLLISAQIAVSLSYTLASYFKKKEQISKDIVFLYLAAHVFCEVIGI